MAMSLAISKGFLKSDAARRAFGIVCLAQPVLLVCLGYYAGALIGKALRFPGSHLSLIWPPTAILLAALLTSPPRRWWLYLIAVIPVHVLVQLQDGVPAWGIISQLIGNFSQALLAAWSLRCLNKEASLFNNFRGVVAFTLAAVIFAPVFVSSIAAYLYVLSGWEQSYSYAWRARALSNALSTLIIVPPIILLVDRGFTAKVVSVKRERYVEASVLIIAVFLIGSISFSQEGEALLGIAYPIAMPLPVLLWSAVRFRLEGLCLALLPIAFFAFTSAADGQSFFAMNAPAENVLSLQFYLIATALPLMLLAVLIQERREKETAVRESEARFRGLVMAGADMVWRADAQGKGFFVSPAWQQLTGHEENQMCDFGWLEAVHPDDRERSRRLWDQAVNQKRAYENELRVRARDGSYRHFHVHAVPILTLEGGVHEWVGANTDITDRKRAESRLKTQYAVTRSLADSTSIDDAAPRILEAICDCLECELGEIWQVNRETNILTYVEKWHLPLAHLTEFASAGRALTFPLGIGLPGRVWESRKPLCIPDVTVDPDFRRTSAARTAGLHGALGFPILLDDEIIGVIVLFTREIRVADRDLLQI